jgi:hypothetical protein
MADFTLIPLNDFSILVDLFEVSSPTGEVIPIESGTVTAFLAQSPTGDIAEETLTATCTYTGSDGRWLISFESNQLPLALLDSLFTAKTTPPHLIVVSDAGVRTYLLGEYARAKRAKLST